MKTNFIISILACMLCSTAAFGQSVQKISAEERAFANQFLAEKQNFVEWLNSPWTGNDAPYAALRSKIETADKQGAILPLIGAYRAEYQSDPTDNVVQFKYFYALWEYTWAEETSIPPADEIAYSNFGWSILKCKYPRTYNYTRLAGLCAGYWSNTPSLYPFLERISKKDPGDTVAKHYMSVVLCMSLKEPLQRQGIAIANDLVAEEPNNARMYLGQGQAYFMRWAITVDPETAKRASDAFHHYLDISPPNALGRTLAVSQLQTLNSGVPPARRYL